MSFKSRFKKSGMVFLAVAMLCNVGTIVTYASKSTQETLLEKQVRMEYENDEQYKLMIKDYGTAYGERFIQDVIKSRTGVSTYGGGGSYCYQDVPTIKQTTADNCGSTTVLQSLYGMGFAGNVSGSTDAQKISTIDKAYNVASQGSLIVYQAVDALNKYIGNSLRYVYTNGNNMSLSQFESYIAQSLTYGKPVILHARTASLPYYNGNNLGHYLNLDSYNRTSETVRIADCNYDSTYFGYHTVNVSEAHRTISRENISDRFLIH